jgi:hypothetical protein
VVRAANPHLPIAEIEAYGTTAQKSNIESSWNHALNLRFSNRNDREDDVIAPDMGIQQSVLKQLIQHDYKEWNPKYTPGGNSIPAEGVRSLTGILCTVQQVLGIDYCPPLPDVGKYFSTNCLYF